MFCGGLYKLIEFLTPPTFTNLVMQCGGQQKSFVTYDALGRQDKTYLPFESPSTGFEAIPFVGMPSVHTEYEASPLSRPLKPYNADNTWKRMEYGANGANDVRR